MKRKLLIILILVFPFINDVEAQITLGAGDFPYAGLSVKYCVADDESGTTLTPLITIGTPGPNGVYNLNGAASHINDTLNINYKDPANTPFPSFQTSCNVAMFWKAFTIFGDTSVWQWSYFNSSATGMTLSKAGVIMDTSYFSHLTHGPLQYFTPNLSNPLEVMSANYALGFNYNDSTKSHILLTGPPALVIASKVIIDLEVDGWGTLTTPNGTYDVLRVKQTRTQAEAFIPPADTNTNFDYADFAYTYQYLYYAKGIGSPIAEVNMNSAFTSVIKVKYATTLPAGICKLSETNELSICPNPASELVRIGFDLKEGRPLSFIITDITGKKVMEKNELSLSSINTIEIDISGLQKGAYLIKILTEGKSLASKFIKM
ncbi:MAG: T9SS type A sorting domain-containing protein [Bacteroidales bacterium]|jgi:hypothetical protein|nr:T9SS type A sorting domain-containing protein [Bacteroidales bacterium]MDD4214969.1 T9SS type A sorting domain-containing protein [Bacteroidales bacterium]